MNDNVNKELFKQNCHTWATWIILAGNVKQWMWYNQSINQLIKI